MNDGREAVFTPGAGIGIDAIGHDEDAGTDAGFAQGFAFFEVTDGEPLGAFVLEGLTDGGSAVAIGIGFDHWHELDASADGALDHAVIERNAIKGNF
jgi:hypothetical protein